MMMKTYAPVALLLLATNVANAESADSRPHAYSSWGAWASPGQPMLLHADRDRSAVRHDPDGDRDRDDHTRGNGIPRSGTATYNGTFTGTGSHRYVGVSVDVKGTSLLTANFGQRSISGTFAGDGVLTNCPAGLCGPNPRPLTNYVNLSGTAPITGNGYAFPSLTGTFNGQVIGSSNSRFVVTSGSGTFSAGAHSTTGIINAADPGFHGTAFTGTFSAKR
jgi:hypothetical protein